jgi:hypothetical protein
MLELPMVVALVAFGMTFVVKPVIPPLVVAEMTPPVIVIVDPSGLTHPIWLTVAVVQDIAPLLFVIVDPSVWTTPLAMVVATGRLAGGRTPVTSVVSDTAPNVRLPAAFPCRTVTVVPVLANAALVSERGPPPAAFVWLCVALTKLAIVGVVSVLLVSVCVAVSVTSVSLPLGKAQVLLLGIAKVGLKAPVKVTLPERVSVNVPLLTPSPPLAGPKIPVTSAVSDTSELVTVCVLPAKWAIPAPGVVATTHVGQPAVPVVRTVPPVRGALNVREVKAVVHDVVPVPSVCRNWPAVPVPVGSVIDHVPAALAVWRVTNPEVGPASVRDPAVVPGMPSVGLALKDGSVVAPCPVRMVPSPAAGSVTRLAEPSPIMTPCAVLLVFPVPPAGTPTVP